MAMLKKISLNILKALGVFIFVVWTYIFIASFHDGPLNTGIFFFDIAPGGAITSGELVSEEPDWSFAKDIPVPEMIRNGSPSLTKSPPAMPNVGGAAATPPPN